MPCLCARAAGKLPSPSLGESGNREMRRAAAAWARPWPCSRSTALATCEPEIARAPAARRGAPGPPFDLPAGPPFAASSRWFAARHCHHACCSVFLPNHTVGGRKYFFQKLRFHDRRVQHVPRGPSSMRAASRCS